MAERPHGPEPGGEDRRHRRSGERYHGLPAALRAQLSEVSEEWAAAKSVPEMGFTLGGIDELMDDEVLCCLAVDGEGNVQGVTSWLPVYDGGTLVSWTLDLCAGAADAFPGVMEFLIASAVLELRKAVGVISLSGSPLAQLCPMRQEPGEHPAEDMPGRRTVLAGILDVVGRALEPVYGFRSLATFKSRFKPDYRTLYLYYQDPLQLPAIGRALSRAYLPGLSVRQSARLLLDGWLSAVDSSGFETSATMSREFNDPFSSRTLSAANNASAEQ